MAHLQQSRPHPQWSRSVLFSNALRSALLFAPLLAACAEPSAAPPGDLDSLPAALLEGRAPAAAKGAPGRRLLTPSAELDITSPVLGNAPGQKAEMAVASGAAQHLVAWHDDRGIVAARVAQDGALLDPHGIPLGPGLVPAISFDGASYLVVTRGYPDQDCSICGVRVGLDGAVLGPTDVPISTGPVHGKPAVVFDGTDHIAVWECDDLLDHVDAPNICRARITPAGAVLDPGGSLIPLDVFRSLSIATDGAGSLVAGWKSTGVQALRLGPDGVALDPAPIVISPPTETDHWADDATVAFDGQSYVVVWSDEAGAGSPYGLYATRVTPAGAVLDPAGIALVSGPGAAGFAPFSSLAAARNGDGLSVFFSQTLDESGFQPLYTLRLSQAGAVLDPAAVALTQDPATGTVPAAASDGASAFVAWVNTGNPASGDSFNHDVLATRVGQDGALVDPGGILLSKSANEQLEPAAAFDGQHYVAVWVDSRGEGQSLWGARLTPAGEAVEPAGFLISDHPGFYYRPRVVFDGESSLVLWHHESSPPGSGAPPEYDTMANRVGPDGAVLSPAPISLGLCASFITGPIAAASTGTSTLVVTDGCDHSSGSDMAAALVDHTDAVIPVDLGLDCAGCFPVLSADGAGYLLAWFDGPELRAARLDAEAHVQDPGAFSLATATDGSCGLVSTFDGQSHVILWTDSQSHLRAVRVTPAGEVLDPQPVDLAEIPGYESCSQAALSVTSDGERTIAAWRAGTDPADPTSIEVQGLEIGRDAAVLSSFAVADLGAEQHLSLAPGAEQHLSLAAAAPGDLLALYSRYEPEIPFRITRVHARRLTCDGPCADPGSNGQGGNGGSGGGGDGDNPASPVPDGGCGCRLAGPAPAAPVPLAALALAALLASRISARRRGRPLWPNRL
ncbi:MAG: hypothetical protein IT372_05400 [Polyangiaceae bacterium]|nr:hypothetical protein [Polyangiaceae bacterium]